MVNIIGPYRTIVRITCEHDDDDEPDLAPSPWYEGTFSWSQDGSLFRYYYGQITDWFPDDLGIPGYIISPTFKAPDKPGYNVEAEFTLVAYAFMHDEVNPETATLNWSIGFTGPGVSLSWGGGMGAFGYEEYTSPPMTPVLLSGGESFSAFTVSIVNVYPFPNSAAGARVDMRYRYVPE